MHKYDKKFYREQGFKVSDEPIRKAISDAAQAAYDHTHYLIFSGTGTKSDIPMIENHIRQYPDVPSFKNHLSVLYKQVGMRVESKKLAMEIINQHPDYRFGRISLAQTYIEEGSLDMAKKMLGEPRNITAFMPDVEVFHHSEFMAYHAVVGMYEMEMDNREAAEKNLEIMIDYNPDHGATETLGLYILRKGFKESEQLAEADEAIKIEVASFPTYTLPQTEAPPKLHHEELEAFYLYGSDDLPEEIIVDILELPRKTLIADLEAILEDSIRRYDYFEKKYHEEFNEEEQSFVIHAAYFLGSLEVKKSLNILLNMFRQGSDFLDFWFGEYFENYFEEVLFFIAKEQPEALKNYMLEPHQSERTRSLALDMLVQIALHFPQRRNEIIEYIKEICEYHFARPDDEGIIDTKFLTDLAGLPMFLRDVSLLEYARKIDERKWLGYMMFGDMEQITKETNLPAEAADIKPMPQNIYEFYNGNHVGRRAKRPLFEEWEKRMNSKALTYMTDLVMKKISPSSPKKYVRYDNGPYAPDDYDEGFQSSSYREYQDPVVRESPKIGRNDPCSCGSGKKYKRCCLNKAS